MKRFCVAMILALSLLSISGCSEPEAAPVLQPASTVGISLPAARTVGAVSVEQALNERRSVREYSDEPLSLEHAAQLLWAAQGVTAAWGGRTAPSAGALYPLELYLVAARVDNLDSGVYRYDPLAHQLVVVSRGEVGGQLSAASLDQASVRDAAAVLVITAVYERTTVRYGDRGVRYVHMEVGHAAQNVYLQVTSLGLGCVVIGAFDDDGLREMLGAAPDEVPLYVIPVGRV